MYISHVSNHLAIMIVVSKATEADLSRATQQPHIRHYFNDQHIFNISSHLFSRASVLRYVFIFCSNFLRPALLLSCGGVAVVVVRFDQGDIDFYSLRALHYHFAQVQFAVRVPDLWTGMLSLPRCCCTLHCRHPARWRRRPRHQHRHCRHYYYCWWCSVDAGCTLIWFLFPKTSGVLHVTGVSASFIALQNCNLENGGRVAWHQ